MTLLAQLLNFQVFSCRPYDHESRLYSRGVLTDLGVTVFENCSEEDATLVAYFRVIYARKFMLVYPSNLSTAISDLEEVIYKPGDALSLE